MKLFNQYTHNLLRQFNEHEVQYLVVGGYAVNFHGYRRTTGDIDLWIKPDNDKNKISILQSLRKLEVEETALAGLEELDFRNPIVFMDGEEPFKIDFMTHISGVAFGEAWMQRQVANLEGLDIPFIHLNHLLISKITSNRPQDKIDVDKLQQIQKLKNE